MSTCAWCDKQIPEDSEVFGLGVKARQGTGLGSYEGEVTLVCLALAKKTVPAIVTTSTSQAKREGNDLMFMTCSQECARLLKEALQNEKDLFDEIRALNLGSSSPPS